MRDPSIDLLRVCLLGYVVAYLHLGGYVGNGETHVAWWQPALTTVVLGAFVFLSGYLLGLWREDSSVSAVLSFYRNRLMRIYPLYLLALACYVALWITDWQTALKAALVLSMFWPEPPATLWFVTMMVVFYCLTPILVVPRATVSIAVWFVAWLSMIVLHQLVQPVDPRVLTHFPAFVAGIACRRFGLRPKLQMHVPVLSLGTAAALALGVAALHSPDWSALAAIPSVLLGPALLLAVVDSWLTLLGRLRWVVWLSYVSFCAYLFHRVVFAILIRVHWPVDAGSQWALLLLVGLPSVLLLSYAVQRLYDHALVWFDDLFAGKNGLR